MVFMVLTDERKGSINGEKMKFRGSFSQLLPCFTFSKTDTSEWEGVEKLQLCMMFEWDKKEMKRSKRWELDSSGFYSIMSKELDKPQCLLDYRVFIRRRQYNSAPLFRTVTFLLMLERIQLVGSTHIHTLTKSHVVSNFYFDLIIFKVLQSMEWWLDTVDSKIAKPQVWFCNYASLWDLILCDG